MTACKEKSLHEKNVHAEVSSADLRTLSDCVRVRVSGVREVGLDGCRGVRRMTETPETPTALFGVGDSR